MQYKSTSTLASCDESYEKLIKVIKYLEEYPLPQKDLGYYSSFVSKRLKKYTNNHIASLINAEATQVNRVFEERTKKCKFWIIAYITLLTANNWIEALELMSYAGHRPDFTQKIHIRWILIFVELCKDENHILNRIEQAHCMLHVAGISEEQLRKH